MIDVYKTNSVYYCVIAIVKLFGCQGRYDNHSVQFDEDVSVHFSISIWFCIMQVPAQKLELEVKFEKSRYVKLLSCIM